MIATPTVQGELPRRIAECLQRLRTELAEWPDLKGAKAETIKKTMVAFAKTFKAELGELAGSVNSSAAERLFGIPVPVAADKDAVNKARAAIGTMAQIAVDLYRECLCSALLPPCGEGCADDCVPLAVVTVQSSDLRIVSICNWSARKFAITAPALQYWIGWLPVFQTLRDNIIRLCCQPARQQRFEVSPNMQIKPVEVQLSPDEVKLLKAAKGFVGAPKAGAAPQGAWTAPAGLFDSLITQFDEAESPLAGLESTVLGALGVQTTMGEPIASDLELANPLAALAIGQLAPSTAGLLSSGGHEDRIEKLEGVVKSLQAKVTAQNRTITALKKGGPIP